VIKQRLRVAAAGAVVLITAGGLLIPGVRDAYPVTRVPQASGLAWVSSDGIGSLTLLDGVAGQPVVNVSVAHVAGNPLLAGQVGQAGYALDEVTGQITKINGSSYAPQTAPERIGGTGTAAFQLLAGTHAIYAVNGAQSSVSVYNAATLQREGHPHSFARGPTSYMAIIDAVGRLWILDQDTGRLSWITGTTVHHAAQAFNPQTVTLTVADGNLVIADTRTHLAYQIGPAGTIEAQLALGSGSGSGLTVSGAMARGAVLVTDNSRNTYRTCTFGLGACEPAWHAMFGGDTLGPAVLADGRAFVPDYSTGTAWVLDPAGATRPVHTRALTEAGPFELFERNGLIFYNDPRTSQAGTISPDGIPRQIVKYSSATPTRSPHTPTPTASSSPSPTIRPDPAPSATPTRRGSSPSDTPTSPAPSPSGSPTGSPSLSPTPTGTPPAGPSGVLQGAGSTGVGGVAFRPGNSNLLATGDISSQAFLWNLSSQQTVRTFHDPNGQRVYGVAFSPDGKVLAADTANSSFNDGSILLWNASTAAVITTLHDSGSKGDGGGLAFRPDGTMLAVPDANGGIYLWNPATRRLINTLHDPGSSQPVYGVAFKPHTSMLAAADGNGNVYLWNTATGTLIRTVDGPHGFGFADVTFSPDGKIVAAASNDGLVHLWNTATGTPAGSLSDHAGLAVSNVVFSPDGATVAATTNNASHTRSGICLWDLATGKLITTLHDPGSEGNFRLAVSPDGRLLVVGDANAHTYLWDMTWLH
jgi:WD domain, G-beta repeat